VEQSVTANFYWSIDLDQVSLDAEILILSTHRTYHLVFFLSTSTSSSLPSHRFIFFPHSSSVFLLCLLSWFFCIQINSYACTAFSVEHFKITMISSTVLSDRQFKINFQSSPILSQLFIIKRTKKTFSLWEVQNPFRFLVKNIQLGLY
jgi:hypothetical protein